MAVVGVILFSGAATGANDAGVGAASVGGVWAAARSGEGRNSWAGATDAAIGILTGAAATGAATGTAVDMLGDLLTATTGACSRELDCRAESAGDACGVGVD